MFWSKHRRTYRVNHSRRLPWPHAVCIIANVGSRHNIGRICGSSRCQMWEHIGRKAHLNKYTQTQLIFHITSVHITVFLIWIFEMFLIFENEELRELLGLEPVSLMIQTVMLSLHFNGHFPYYRPIIGRFADNRYRPIITSVSADYRVSTIEPLPVQIECWY